MTRIYLFIIILFISNNNYAQWILQNPKLQAERLSDVFVVDSTTAFACGRYGTILKSIDRGDTWKLLNSGTKDIFSQLFFINANTGWALTYSSNKLYRTTDGGNTWSLISQFDSKFINELFFINEKKGFITGDFNSVLTTDDGGDSWYTLNITETLYSGSSSISMVNKNEIYLVINSSKIYQSNDGGYKWQPLNLYTTPNGFINKIIVFDSLSVYLCGSENGLFNTYYFFSKTLDGGKSWDKIYFERPISEIHFTDINYGEISDNLYSISITEDGGKTWYKTQSIAGKVSHFDLNTVLGLSGSNLIKKTTDRWLSYKYVTHSITSELLHKISPLDSLNAVACGDNELIIKTTDGGITWEQIHRGSNKVLKDIEFLSDQEIISCGEGIILRSVNGGQTWSRDSLEVTWFNDIECIGNGNIYVVGSAIYFSQNRGESWSKQIVPGIDVSVEKIKFGNNFLGWLIANNTIFRTKDSGQNWEIVEDINVFYGGIDAKDSSVWLTNQNIVITSSDFGESWMNYKMFDYDQTFFSTYCISMQNSSDGSVGLYDGRILDTHDGGKTWQIAASITSTPIYDVKWVDNNHAWAVGDMGLILKYSQTVVSVDNISNANPNSFYLLQNFPNPFNPITTIRYSITNKSKVSLKIFDITGREIETLADKWQPPGEHLVDFNAQNLASGIYIYRLQVGQLIKHKKMILLK